jgi:hypothetical protein
MPCAVCTVHVETICQWFGLKTTRTIFSDLASKPVATIFSDLASKPVAMVSPDLASKPVVSFLVEPQNQGGDGFLGLGLKTGSYSLVIWSSKSPRWFLGLGLKTKQATVYRLRHKIDRRATAWDTRRISISLDLSAPALRSCYLHQHVALRTESLCAHRSLVF